MNSQLSGLIYRSNVDIYVGQGKTAAQPRWFVPSLIDPAAGRFQPL
jgi:hypothetical protein